MMIKKQKKMRIYYKIKTKVMIKILQNLKNLSKTQI